MDPEELPIPKVSAAQLELRNRLMGIRRLITFSVGETDWTLSFVVSETLPDALGVHLKLDGHDLYVCLRDLDPLVNAAVPDVEDIAALPEQILLGVLELTFEEVLFDVEAAIDGAMEIVGILSAEQSRAHAASCGQVGLLLQNGEHRISGALLASDAALIRMAELVCLVPPQQASVGHLPLQVRVELGAANLSQKELLSLQQNDVVILEELYAPAGCAVLTAEGLPAWQIAVQEDGIQLQQPWLPSGSEVGTGLPVRFQTASLTMPFCDYSSLSAGTQLSVRTTGQTTLTVHGRAIAVGRLVEFRGRTGLQISGFPVSPGQLSAPSDGPADDA